MYETKHNPATEIQAIFRSYRIGQSKPVHVYRLVAQVSCNFKLMTLIIQLIGHDGRLRFEASNCQTTN